MQTGTFFTLQRFDGQLWIDDSHAGSYPTFEEASTAGLTWALEASANYRVVRTTVEISQRAYAPIAQCSWGAGGDPAEGCDAVATWQDLCKVHARVTEILNSHVTVEMVNTGDPVTDKLNRDFPQDPDYYKETK